MSDTPPKTHNSDPGGKLGVLVDRVVRLKEEQAAIGEDVNDIFAEAKGNGYDIVAFRQTVKVRMMDSDNRQKWKDQQEQLDVYLMSLGLL